MIQQMAAAIPAAAPAAAPAPAAPAAPRAPLEDFASPHALVAHRWQGKPLTREHGGPARLVIPHLYFWKSAKWISRIDFLGADKPGFWEVNGYHLRGDPWAEQRYS